MRRYWTGLVWRPGSAKISSSSWSEVQSNKPMFRYLPEFSFFYSTGSPVIQKPVADELFDKKDTKTIKRFLSANLDTSKTLYILTDFYSSYPSILKEMFGDILIHQYCLFHLNNLIVKDFPRYKWFKTKKLANTGWNSPQQSCGVSHVSDYWCFNDHGLRKNRPSPLLDLEEQGRPPWCDR